MTVLAVQEKMWAGGMARLPDGSWYVVYQRDIWFPENSGFTSVAWGRTTPSLLAPIEEWGPEEWIHGDAFSRAFDPDTVVLADGNLGITFSSIDAEDGCWFMQRSILGPVFTTPTRLDGCWQGKVRVEGSAEALDTAECTFQKILGKYTAAYNARPTEDRSAWQLRTRRWVNGSWQPFVVVGSPGGTGPSGDQKRITLSSTGNLKEILAVWGAPLGGVGVNRTLVMARSLDSGASYGPAIPLLWEEAADLVNPFLLRRDPDLFIFFTRNPGAFAYLHSTDKGATWWGPFDVPLAPHQRNVSRCVIGDQDGTLVCFSAYAQDGVNTLGTFPILV